ncbi:MAG TPA: hypothetical protein VHW23_14850 [Kofleriaceae bacterium]|nr:hypothetical protein [Kofleriaceae bacterium]
MPVRPCAAAVLGASLLGCGNAPDDVRCAPANPPTARPAPPAAGPAGVARDWPAPPIIRRRSVHGDLELLAVGAAAGDRPAWSYVIRERHGRFALPMVSHNESARVSDSQGADYVMLHEGNRDGSHGLWVYHADRGPSLDPNAALEAALHEFAESRWHASDQLGRRRIQIAGCDAIQSDASSGDGPRRDTERAWAMRCPGDQLIVVLAVSLGEPPAAAVTWFDRTIAQLQVPAAPELQGSKQVPHHPELREDGFDLWLRDGDPREKRVVERIVHASSLPLGRIAPDQRADDAPIVARSQDDDDRRDHPRFTALGAFPRSGRRYLALVEADGVSSHLGEGPELDRVVETPLVFRAGTRRADTGRLGKVRWRRWRFVEPSGSDEYVADEPEGLMNPSLLVVEATDGTPAAVRQLGPHSLGPPEIQAIDLDGTPLLVITSENDYEGTSLASRTEVVAFSGGALVHALDVTFGRIYVGPPIEDNHDPNVGPPGSIRVIDHELRVQAFGDGLSNMGCVAPADEAGTDPCHGEERRYRWSAADRKLVEVGAPRPIRAIRGKRWGEITMGDRDPTP